MIITPHAQRERGKVIGRGVHIYMSVVEKKFESYFRDRLIIIMNRSQELTIFHGRQKLTSAKNKRPEK